jgi:hypothetical protein
MSAVWIWVIVLVAVVALAVWLGSVFLASRHPGGKNPDMSQRRAQVDGGTHMGGGRSVAPRRDAEVIPDEDPTAPTVPVQERRNSPMDL